MNVKIKITKDKDEIREFGRQIAAENPERYSAVMPERRGKSSYHGKISLQRKGKCRPSPEAFPCFQKL